MVPGPPPHPQLVQDADHLRLLVIFHYILGALTIVFGSFPVIHIGMGVMMVSGKMPSGASGPPPEVGWLFIGLGSVLILLFWTVGALLIVAARFLSQRRRHTFCFVIACLSCLNIPLGTALGILSILVLQRPSVRALFEGQAGLPAGGYLGR